jgi:hypothetical protein
MERRAAGAVKTLHNGGARRAICVWLSVCVSADEVNRAMLTATVPSISVRGEVSKRAQAYVYGSSTPSTGRARRSFVPTSSDPQPDPARSRPAHIEVSLDVTASPYERTSAHTFREAGDLVEEGSATPGQLQSDTYAADRPLFRAQWRHGDLPRQPTPYPRRSNLEVVRRKTIAVKPMTQDGAAYEMELLDHDFYHSLISKPIPVLLSTGSGRRLWLASQPRRCNRRRLRNASMWAATFRVLSRAGWRRAQVLYRRYDGHYGPHRLLTVGPAAGCRVVTTKI